jgi:alkylation response protein AidB-like acyl-CoA dehydrogenase
MRNNTEALLTAVQDLSPALTARSAEIEAKRELPKDLLAELLAAGCFRISAPRSHGGLELDLPATLTVLETLGRADGSTAWLVMVNCQFALLLPLLPKKRFDALFAGGPDVIAAGSITPRGEVQVVDGGYEVTGRWPFASGCKHCHWLIASGVVMENGAPRPSPVPDVPQRRSILVPVEQATIFDTWSVSGLKGTGSHDFAVQALQVPEEDTFDPLFGQSSVPGPLYGGVLTQGALHMAAVAVGIAQHAIDDITAMAIGQKRRSFTRVSMAETPLFQYRLGQAETTVRAARAALKAEAEAFWATAVSGRAPSQLEQCQMAGLAAWVTETATTVVNTCYTAGGATALYDTSPLQRHLRDIHALTQHIMVAEGWLTKAGAALLGQEVGLGL